MDTGATGVDEAQREVRDDDPVSRILELTDGLGADVAIEAVGVPETFELCTRLIRPGGHLATVGVHGKRPRCTSKTCGSRT